MQHWFRSLLSITFISMIVLGLIACSDSAKTDTQEKEKEKEEPKSQTIEITHELGTEVFDTIPQKVVVLEFSYTDALTTLGVKPVGLADDDNPDLLMDVVKEQLGEYTSVGSRYEPNIEKISTLQPDLIIADLNHHEKAYEQLKAIAPTIVLDDHQADYHKMLENYMVIAKALGKEAEGKQRLEEHKKIIAEAKEKLGNTNMSVLPAVVNPKGFFAHSNHSYTGSFIESLGFVDPVKNEESYPKLGLEQLVETNPEAIFLLPATEETILDEWENNPLWQEINAVKNGKVFKVERRDWALSRGLLGAEKMVNDIVDNLGEK